MTYHFRYFTDESDYAAMRQLLLRCYAKSGPLVYLTLGDLDWWRYGGSVPTPVGVIPLWFAGDQLAGFAWPAFGNLDMVPDPDHRAVELDMLAWAELNAVAPTTEDRPAYLRVWCMGSDHARQRVMEISGYTPDHDFYTLHSFDLSAPVPEPVLPPGFTLSHVSREEDIEPRVEVHRAAFHPSRMTVAKHKAVMASLTYRPTLDLVVVTPEGSFAAFCIVWYDPEYQSGLFEPVGVHPDYQRRGLGRAIMYAGLRKLKELGAHSAQVLSVRNDSPGAYLYQASGFRAIDRYQAWIKQFEG